MKNVLEDFDCLVCGAKNVGNGRTDHCKNCLWGRHVDFETPGDRLSPCRGRLEPTKVLYVKGKFRIEYKCVLCNHFFVVDKASDDSSQELDRLMRK